jgi:signal transduction histidine kinase
MKTGEITLSENRVGFLPVTLDPNIPVLFGVVHPDDREKVLGVHEDAVRNRGSYEIECRVFDEAGRLRWVHRKGQVVCDSTGQPVRVFGVTQDITERKKNLEALAEAERVAALARTAARMVIWTVNLDTAEVQTEPGLPSLLGFGAADGAKPLGFWLDRIYEPDRTVIASLKEYVQRSFVEGQGEIHIPELEYRMYHADGSLRWFLTRATVERNPNGSPRRIVGTAMDVTKRKTAELESEEQRRELTRLARISALGEISATLAHELAQPLTSILSNAQAARLLLDRESPDLPEIGRILDDITSEDRRAGEVIRQLRTLLRKGTPQVQDVDVNAVVEEILGLMRSDLITRNVTVSTFLEEVLPPVQANPVELKQVLLNLILNACDAMERNPRQDRTLTVTTRLESSSVVVAVSDVGSGIPAENVTSLFKPFFTTKSHGIGIGLSICQSIIAAVGGRVWAENNSDRGATFRFALPSAESRSRG